MKGFNFSCCETRVNLGVTADMLQRPKEVADVRLGDDLPSPHFVSSNSGHQIWPRQRPDLQGAWTQAEAGECRPRQADAGKCMQWQAGRGMRRLPIKAPVIIASEGSGCQGEARQAWPGAMAPYLRYVAALKLEHLPGGPALVFGTLLAKRFPFPAVLGSRPRTKRTSCRIMCAQHGS